MMNRTHALSGAATWLAGCALLGVPLATPATVVGAAVCAISATLPDLDHPCSRPTKFLGPPGALIALVLHRRFGHRGATHWLSTGAGVGLTAGVAAIAGLGWTAWWAGLAVAVGMAVHDLGDATTIGGVPLLGPWSRRRVHLMPPGLRLWVGGRVEAFVVFPFFAAGALAAIVNLH